MNAPLHVVHVITDLFTGGAEMMLYKLLQKLHDHNIRSTVVSLRDEGTLGERIKALGVPIHTLEMSPSAPSPFALWKLKKLFKALKPDLIQGWMYHGNLAAQWACSNVPVVWNIRQSLYDLGTEKRATAFLIRLGARVSKRPHAIIYNSQTSAKQHEALGYDKRHRVVLPNGFDPETFKPNAQARREIRAELNVGDETKLIGLIARFHLMKDHANFIRAASLLVRERDDVVFLLAGKGIDSDNESLVNLLNKESLSEKFRLLGERSDVPRLTAALDMATSSSAYNEGFPNVIGEAMLCGVPCVVTDVGDSAKIVGHTGKVVPPRNSQALAEAWQALLSLLKVELEALKKSARQRVLDCYTIEKVTKDYAALYRSVAAKIN